MEGRLIFALLVCFALTEYGLGIEFVIRVTASLKKLKCLRKSCTMEYLPVCGSDGKTYPNQCRLEGADCLSEEDITKVHAGPCKLKCRRKSCTVEYAPVCGSDGKTYGNICFLNVADCESEEDIRIVHPRPCGVACPSIGCINPCPFGYATDKNGCPTCQCKKPNCLKPCPRIKAPVCGSDGKTYSNECVLENADCLSEEDITKVHDGPCSVECPAIECIKPCPFGYVTDENGCTTCQCEAPVCGSDGTTYSNECVLENANCLSEEDITKVHDGFCGVPCPAIECIKPCPFGYVTVENRCPTCQCKKLKCQRKSCTVEYAPVCGSDGKTYGNICFLNVADCESEEDIRIVHPGPCGVLCPAIECIKPCPFGYVTPENGCPTCQCKSRACPAIGCINPCPFGYATDKNGCPTCQCKKPNCLKPCPRIKAPVCGSNGKTYSNECVLENADCLSEEDVTKVHDGPCSS